MTTAPAKNLQRILVVDDEPSISELISTSPTVGKLPTINFVPLDLVDGTKK
jgi:hypothetical protein